MKNGKLTNLPHQEVDRSRTGLTGRGLRREVNKGKTTRGGEGCEVALDKLMAATTLRASAAEDMRDFHGFERVQVVLRCSSVDL